MARFTPRVEHLDGDVFDTIQAFCRLVVPKASPHDGRNAMRGEKTGCPNIQFRALSGRAPHVHFQSDFESDFVLGFHFVG